MANKLKLRTRIMMMISSILVLSILIVTTTVMIAIATKNNNDTKDLVELKNILLETQEKSLKEILNIAYNVLEIQNNEYKKGVKTLSEAQEDAIKEINKMRYGDDGYFWINDLEPKMIDHPSYPIDSFPSYYRTKGLVDYVDVKGKKLFVEFVDVCKSSGEGSVEYYWTKPGRDKSEQFPKMSYVKLFSSWNWIIGTGVYIDNITDYIQNKTNDGKLFIKNLVIIIIVIIIAVLILSIFVGLLLTYSISNPINKVSKELSGNSSNLESAAYQISSSSQQLSSGSSELASSIEEITSSIEELQSVIESNTKNINQSEIMMRETNEGSKNVTDKMKELQQALIEINDNSRKIVRIIKVIEDIAFQTNILALNAAVEAARAGEAGRGFAVVADQVKSLAQKSSEAAKETAQLIENAIESVGKGDSLGKIVLEVQGKAGEMTEKVSTLLDEVNRASKEQMKGVNQISQAVSQTNSVVQQTASSAEETAAASEELLTQAEGLNNIVDTLNIIVIGKVKAKTTVNNKKNEHKTIKQLPEIKQKSKEVELVKPEDKIPLEDFNDF